MRRRLAARTPVGLARLAARRPARDAARGAVGGVVVGLGAAAGSGGPLPARHGDRLPRWSRSCSRSSPTSRTTCPTSGAGADTPDRQGPLRVAAAGLVTQRQLEVAIGLTIGLGRRWSGLALAYVGGPVLIVLGLLAVVAALAYTGGPWPYGYRGLGEVFVFVFFGLVAVVGTAYLQTAAVRVRCSSTAAIPVGALITGILVVNNLRDIPTDRGRGQADARGDAGRSSGAQIEYAALLARGVRRADPAGAAPRLASCCSRRCSTLPLAVPLLRTVRAFGDPRQLNAVLKGTARLALVFARPVRVRAALAHDAGRVAPRRQGRGRVPPAVRDRDRHVARPRGVAAPADRRRRADRGGGGGPRARRRRDRRTPCSTLLVREAVAIGARRAPADGRRARVRTAGRGGRCGRRSMPRGSTSMAPRRRRCSRTASGVGVNATLPFLGPGPVRGGGAPGGGGRLHDAQGQGRRRARDRRPGRSRPRGAAGGRGRTSGSASTSTARGTSRRRPSGSRRWSGSPSSTWSSRWPATTPRSWPSCDGACGCRSRPTRPSSPCVPRGSCSRRTRSTSWS